MAAREGYDSIVKFLVDEGADINMGDCDGVCEAILQHYINILCLDNSDCVSIISYGIVLLL